MYPACPLSVVLVAVGNTAWVKTGLASGVYFLIALDTDGSAPMNVDCGVVDGDTCVGAGLQH